MKVSTITKVSEESEVPEVPAAGEEPIVSKGKVEKRGGNRFGYNYIFIKSYKESQKNDVVKCLYIKSLTNFGFCVIKEGCYGDTKDKWGRDIIDRLKWQYKLHDFLQGKLPFPRLLGKLEINGNYYLIIEHISGSSLHSFFTKHRFKLPHSLESGNALGVQLLDYLCQIIDILILLQQEGIVHRDVTPNNFMITRSGKVYIIDPEMAYSIPLREPFPCFQQGTYGYMSPQQERADEPTYAEDVFAFGAILFQAWTGFGVAKFKEEEDSILHRKISFFVSDDVMARLIARCLSVNDTRRPTVLEIKTALFQYRQDLKSKRPRTRSIITPYDHPEIQSIIQSAYGALCSPLMADSEKGWFSNDLKPSVDASRQRFKKAWYGSYSNGVAGILAVIGEVSRAEYRIDSSQIYVKASLSLIAAKYLENPPHRNGGVYNSGDGVAASIALLSKYNIIDPQTDCLGWIQALIGRNTDDFTLGNGLAGQGLVFLLCEPYLADTTYKQQVTFTAQRLLAMQDKKGTWFSESRKQRWTGKMTPRVKRGMGDGMAGVIWFLLEYASRFKDAKVLAAAERGLLYLERCARKKGGAMVWQSSSGKELSYGWNEGISGIAFIFIQAYRITNREKYRRFAELALKGIPANHIEGSISQFNGLCGIGEVYLEAYRVFKDNYWYERAGQIAQTVLTFSRKHPNYGHYWLVENERFPIGSVSVGNSGVLHFLSRYMHPEKIGMLLFSELGSPVAMVD